MKQTTFTFLLFATIALVSCRKDNYGPTIREYDEDQIKSYISTNGITGMTRDTSGIYYNISNAGTGAAIDYSDDISVVFSVRSVDGKYVSTDTISNHFQEFAGHITNINRPLGIGVPGVQLAIHNIINHHGGAAHIIVPSRLAYGVSGAGSGSSSLTSGRIAGNQSLDYYIHIVDNQAAYDVASIKRYLANNNLTSVMQYDPAGFWYQISTPGTGTVPITDNSTIGVTYTASIFNGLVVDQYNSTPAQSFDVPDLIQGVQIALKKYATAGALIRIIMPSSLAYGKTTAGLVPANSCFRFDVQVVSVAP
ncbi:MAG: FKBP-type peptidyl-prolyl cis-trans isomerase [Mucilaginibacter sp.]|nr:FKBP-type peptidyl-prolyl cis-trans isomerase [Mucilaginibacter sp.]